MALLRPHMGAERVTLARPHRHRASHAVRTHGHTIAIVSAHRLVRRVPRRANMQVSSLHKYRVCLLVCVAQQQAMDCTSLCKPQWRLQRAAATWALAMACGLVVGPARARVEPCGGHGYAVHARPVCAVVGRVDGVQRPLLARLCLWAAVRASTDWCPCCAGA